VSVDVGAGGFCGTTTTDPILDAVGGRVICIEADKQRSEALAAKYGARIANIHGYYGKIGANTPHDLVVIDLDSNSIPYIFDSLLGFAIKDGLKPGGFLISLIVYNIAVAYDGTPGFPHPDGKEAQASFVQRYFGSQVIDAPLLQEKFRHDPDFEFIALVDKELGYGRNCIGWVVLRRRRQPADARGGGLAWFRGLLRRRARA